MNADRIVQDLSATQGGAIRLDQALGSGMSRNQVRHRLQTGRWATLVRGCYLITAMATIDDHLRAAVAALPGAVVSHEAAAESHGLSYVKRGLATVLVHSQTTHEFPGVIVRRCHDLALEHVEFEDGLPTTTVPRTIVDLAPFVSEKNLAAILDDAVAARTTSVGAVAEAAALVGRAGKPGTKKMRSVIEERSGTIFRGSELERRGNQLLQTIEGAEPFMEYPIPWCSDKRFDVAYPAARLAIEWDSRRWHTQVAAFQTDRARDRDAIVNDWRILRFTWEDVTERPHQVVSTVRRALGQRTASTLAAEGR